MGRSVILLNVYSCDCVAETHHRKNTLSASKRKERPLPFCLLYQSMTHRDNRHRSMYWYAGSRKIIKQRGLSWRHLAREMHLTAVRKSSFAIHNKRSISKMLALAAPRRMAADCMATKPGVSVIIFLKQPLHIARKAFYGHQDMAAGVNNHRPSSHLEGGMSCMVRR